MLSGLYSEHQHRQSQRKSLQEGRRQEAAAAAQGLTHALVDHLNVGVAQAYLNQKRLDAEAKQLHSHAAQFSKQTAQWIQLVDGFNGTLKELGEVEAWSKSIEGDLKVITTALEYTYKVNREANLTQPPAAATALSTSASAASTSTSSSSSLSQK